MSEDFRIGFRAKVERAEEHIQNLKAESDAFFLSEPKPYRIVREPQEEGPGYIWKGFQDRLLPPIIPILAGEAIHQLRSSLDHLVTGMALAKGNAVTKKHGFPITHKPEDFKRARFERRQIDGISLAAQNLIERKQPYNAPDGYASSILWTLDRQDIEDKHKLLVVVAACAFMDSFSITASPDSGTTTIHNLVFLPGPQRMTKEGVELLRVDASGEVNPSLDPNAKFSPLVAFEEFGTVKLKPVFQALGQARDFVVQTLNDFAGEFPIRPHESPDAAVRDRSYLRPGGRPDRP